MKLNYFLRALLGIFILAVIGFSLWLGEIIYFKTWASTRWLKEDLYSPYVIFLLASGSFLLPFIFIAQISKVKIGFALALFYGFNMLAFMIGEFINRVWYCRTCRFLDLITYESINYSFWYLGLINYLAWSLLYAGVVKYILGVNKHFMLIVIITLIFNTLTIPLSMLSINLYNFASSNDWADAVKMGYPVFWTIFMLGMAGLTIISLNKR